MLELYPNHLWLGHALHARDPRGLFDAGIKAVVDVAYAESPAVLPRDFIYCRFPLVDGGSNDPRLLRLTLQTVINLLDNGFQTLLACSLGMSRSPTVAAFALAAHLKRSPEDVVLQIASLKGLELNGALWNDVREAANALGFEG